MTMHRLKIARLVVPLVLCVGILTAAITPINGLNSAGSDAQAAAFQSSVPTINQYIQANTFGSGSGPYIFFPTGDGINTAVISDPASLNLQSNSFVRAYYLNPFGQPSPVSQPAPASYNQDTLGFNINHDYMLSPGQQALILSANGSTIPASPPNVVTDTGQFVNLGELSAGTFLDFFLLATNASGTTAFWNDPTQNPDGAPHLAMVQFLQTPYYLLAWEDTSFGSEIPDDDLYRDLFAVIEVVPTPEPMTYLTLAGLLGVVFIVSRKRGITARS